MNRFSASLTITFLFIFLGLSGTTPRVSAEEWQSLVEPALLKSFQQEDFVEFVIFLDAQADLARANHYNDKVARGTYVYQELSTVAQRSQAPLISYLEGLDVDYQSFWIANMIKVTGSLEILKSLASRADVDYIYANQQIITTFPTTNLNPDRNLTTDPLPWNLDLLGVSEVWARGYIGQNVVIGGQDTGYAWSHPALRDKYRGWDGLSAEHQYNWHDAIHSGGGICGANTVEPCDDHGHGTHTMGIMVGQALDGPTIGMAPGAKWIGCRNMDVGIGTPTTYSECYQWFVAPTDLNGQDPKPEKAPHIINNSWGCPLSEGCTNSAILETVVNNVRAAGILTVHSAGNNGPGCGTINTPGAIYDASFTVGATISGDIIWSGSSRGPAVVNGLQYLKPDIVAPGVNIYSSLRDGTYGYKSGTSMAAPHVAGLAALLISADPSLAGNVNLLEILMQVTAEPLYTGQTCGGIPSSIFPNNTVGYGRIDPPAAVNLTTGPKYFFPIFPNFVSFENDPRLKR